MTLTLVIVMCASRRISLSAWDGHLRVEAPPGAVTPEIEEALAEHKERLLRLFGPPRQFITLKGGLTVPVEAVELAIDLERRGVMLRTDDEQELIEPAARLVTPLELCRLRRWRLHLAALVEYEAGGLDG